MQTHSIGTIDKMVTFSSSLYDFVNLEARELGITLQEYIRHLVLIERRRKESITPVLNDEDTRGVMLAMEDFKNGNHIRCKSPKETDSYLDELDKREV